MIRAWAHAKVQGIARNESMVGASSRRPRAAGRDPSRRSENSRIGAFSNKKATFLLAGMATQPSLDNQCTAAENADNDHFYCEPKTSDLTAVFSAVATQLANGKAHLIQLYPIPTLTAISPTTGTRNGGTTVTITGTSFSGTTSVTFAGTNALSFTVVNDTTITAKSPAGPNGTAADVRVTTPGGTTTAVAADLFTYN